jgi:hypothetical protein
VKRPEAPPLIQPNDRINIPGTEYQGGGAGDWLRMRVTKVLPAKGQDVRDMTYVQVTGFVLQGGDEVGERTVIVRVAAFDSWPPTRPETER